MDEPRRRIAGMLSGLDIHYDLGDGPPAARATHARPRPADRGRADPRVHAAARRAGPCCSTSAHPAASTSRRGRTGSGCVDAAYDGAWELPVLGEVAAPPAVLIRPDGHVAWAGELTDPDAAAGALDLVRPGRPVLTRRGPANPRAGGDSAGHRPGEVRERPRPCSHRDAFVSSRPATLIPGSSNISGEWSGCRALGWGVCGDREVALGAAPGFALVRWCGGGESACTPDSVEDGHPSRPAVTRRLQRSTRELDGPPAPCLTLLQVGFTEPSGSPRTLVRSYRTVAPLPVRTGEPARHRRSVLCGTVLRVAPTGCYPAPCPVESGRSSDGSKPVRDHPTGSPPPRGSSHVAARRPRPVGRSDARRTPCDVAIRVRERRAATRQASTEPRSGRGGTRSSRRTHRTPPRRRSGRGCGPAVNTGAEPLNRPCRRCRGSPRSGCGSGSRAGTRRPRRRSRSRAARRWRPVPRPARRRRTTTNSAIAKTGTQPLWSKSATFWSITTRSAESGTKSRSPNAAPRATAWRSTTSSRRRHEVSSTGSAWTNSATGVRSPSRSSGRTARRCR